MRLAVLPLLILILAGPVYGLPEERERLRREAWTLNDQGWDLWTAGRLDPALEHYRQALAVSRRAGGFDLGEAYAWNGIGWVRSARGEWQGALDAFGSAQALSRRAGDRRWQGITLMNGGLVYWHLADHRRAFEHFQRALPHARAAGDRLTEAQVLICQGSVYWPLGRHAEALELYERALALARDAGEAQPWAIALDGLGWIRALREDFAGSLPYFQQALPLTRRAGDLIWEAQTLTNLGMAHLGLGDLEEAFRFLQQAVALKRAIQDREGEAMALFYLARAEAARGDLEAALQRIKAVLEIVESNRQQVLNPGLRALYLSFRQQYYGLHVDLLVRLHERHPRSGYAALAFAAAERGKARALAEVLQVESTRPLEAEEARALLDDSTALVSYSLGGESAFGFLLTRDALRVQRLPALRHLLERRVESYVDLLSRGVLANAIGRRLHADLLAPLLRGLPAGVDRLVVLPDGLLHDLPFEAIPTEEGVLVEDFAISYAPSAAVLARLRAAGAGSRRDADRVLVFAPSSTGTLEPLRFTSQEARAIARSAGNDLVVHAGPEATERRFKSTPIDDFQVIHFASHGLVRRDDPERSGLALGTFPGDGEDGLLRAGEVAGLTLRSELVVLSACQTARGRNLPGEGVQGLARAFLRAGSRSVVATLWDVDDERSARFMDRFYRHLAAGLPKAEALRAAKLDLLADRRASPRDWAPFVLLGEADSGIRLRSRKPWPGVALAASGLLATVLAGLRLTFLRTRDKVSA